MPAKRIALLNALRQIGYSEADDHSNSSDSDASSYVSDHEDPAAADEDIGAYGDNTDDSDGELQIEEESDETDVSSVSAESDSDTSSLDLVQHVSPSGILWDANPPPLRRLNRNIVDFRSGPRIVPRSEYEAFSLFIDEIILRTIQRYTNRRMRARGKLPFTFNEVKAAIGIIIRAGADRDNMSSVESLFNPKDSRPFYSCAMAKNRFRHFLRYVTFDNKVTRRRRQQIDKLAAIRELWDHMQTNFRRYYEPSEWLTVDEQLYAYRGYSPGRTYMPAKPAKYGIKVFWCCDAKNGFALESFLYSGRDGDQRAVGLAKRIVLQLTKQFYRTSRNVFVDRYFSSHDLLDELLQNGLTMTGTLSKNRRDVPAVLKSTRGREVFDSVFLWNHENRALLLSYTPKKNKNVLLISSMHNSGEISAREDRKPVVIQDYNVGKCGVDLMDSRIEDFTCKRKTNRYPLVFFFNMLDVCLLNSFLLMGENYESDRKSFIKIVAEKLAEGNIRSRANNKKIYSKVKGKFSQYGVIPEQQEDFAHTARKQPRKCHVAKCRKSTRITCNVCSLYVCSLHKITRVKCHDCQ